MDWLTLDTWVTSDQHWEHPKIREYQDRPADHFELMRRLWLEAVGLDDELLHLGDLVCFGDRSRHPFWIKDLSGRKKLILGNHDKHSAPWYEAAGFEVLGRGNKAILDVELDGSRVVFSHEPLTVQHIDYPYMDETWDVNVHGHTHANDPWSQIPGKRYVNVCVEKTGYGPVRLRDVL